MGEVRDGAGLAIPNAAVELIHAHSGIAVRGLTNSNGSYAFDDLPLGKYSLRISSPSFRQLRIEGIEIHVATAIRQDATLEVAPVTAVVAVESSTPLVRTETAEIGQLVDANQVADLP